MKKALIFSAVLLALSCTAIAQENDLYPATGITPLTVKQGTLGSCYFHSVVAALANTQPEVLRHAITKDKGQLRVHFADGTFENVYMDDVTYARESGYDRSDGLWVAVLFRGYAQRVLRDAIQTAIMASDYSLPVRKNSAALVGNSDLLLLAYDRAIRNQVDQYGNINREQLRATLQRELKPLALPEPVKTNIVSMLDQKGYFDALQEKVKQNGELFGAFRAVGQGGFPERVFKAFTGEGSGGQVTVAKEKAIAEILTEATAAKVPITAATGTKAGPSVISSLGTIAGGKPWYVEGHAYTVLGYDPEKDEVTIRNPWGDHPSPDGVFTLSLNQFIATYEWMSWSLAGHGKAETPEHKPEAPSPYPEVKH
jgi:calpain family cysteine protease